MPLVNGMLYSGAMHLGFLEKSLASVAAISAKFTDAGFINVTVDDQDAGNPRANGTWGLPTQSNVQLPSEVQTVWVWEVDVAP